MKDESEIEFVPFDDNEHSEAFYDFYDFTSWDWVYKQMTDEMIQHYIENKEYYFKKYGTSEG